MLEYAVIITTILVSILSVYTCFECSRDED
jgi:hypothetical protein